MPLKHNWITLDSYGKIIKRDKTGVMSARSLKEAMLAIMKYAKELEENKSEAK